MGSQILQRALGHFALALVAQDGGRILQREPVGVLYLDPHLGRNVSQASGAVEQQIEADDLEHARAVAPVAHVVVLDIGQLGHQVSLHPGFFADLAEGRLLRLLSLVDGALGQSHQCGRRLSRAVRRLARLFRTCHVRLDDRQKPAASHLPQHDTSRREFAHHERPPENRLVWQTNRDADNQKRCRVMGHFPEKPSNRPKGCQP